ncbi:hypothetical protein ACH5RR_011608 [Cinchona calisaya]|uniref:BHLH domain-containing protein n=1 Tax=Cinchona calisaya TaxID=153742 RepID=A0ABD3A8Z1_9GENT
MAPKGSSYWTTLPGGENEIIFPNGWNSGVFDHTQDLSTSNSSLLGLISPAALLAEQESAVFAFPFAEELVHEPFPFLDGFTAPPELGNSSYDNLPPLPIQEEYEDGQLGILGHNLHDFRGGKEVENQHTTITSLDASTVGVCGEKKKVKKVEGQPSKNLMAERRRRKRLNDRLSMLRSIVPKISKMDRTSILGDTIDYMKELLDKINKLREERMDQEDKNQMNIVGNLKELKPNEIHVRNPPKFDVERRNLDTRIEICCTGKPGMLLSTVSTLEALGLDIQQCVISCFNDFSVQASCSEVAEHRRIIGSEDVKQALFRNAGYGGRCM